MKKRIFCMFSFMLVLVILLMSFSGCGSFKLFEVLGDTNSYTNIADGDETLVPSDGLVSGGQDAHTLHYAYKDSDLHAALIVNGNQVLFGVTTTSLKPNTRYKIHWSINPLVDVGTSAYFSTETLDGVEKFCVYLDPSYVENEGLGERLVSTQKSVMLKSSWEFTSGNEGDSFLFSLLRFEFQDVDQASAVARQIDEYIQSIVIIEVK